MFCIAAGKKGTRTAGACIDIMVPAYEKDSVTILRIDLGIVGNRQGAAICVDVMQCEIHSVYLPHPFDNMT